MAEGNGVMRRALELVTGVLIVVVAAACGSGLQNGPSGGLGPDDPDTPIHFAGAAAVPGQYIVVFREGARVPPGLARRLVDEYDGDLEFEYTAALNGFAARLPPQALQGLRRNPHVAWIEQDMVVQVENVVQSDATWGLDRIDQRALPLDNTYSYSHSGEGVTVYIIDSGIRFDHVEFGGRAVRGTDVVGDGMNGVDCHGHGSHVSGTVGGSTWGVAKRAQLVSVRVIDCTGRGTSSGLIAGIEWVIRNNGGPAVANISLGVSGVNESVNAAVRNLIASGVQVSIAAGNSDTDACTVSPASTLEAVTVGAAGSSNRNERRLSSNWGPCIDVFAPGSIISSVSHLDTASSTTKSGTSMAAPHAAGVMALWLHEDPALTPAELHRMIGETATQNIVTNAKSANAHMLYSLRQDGATQPSASFTSSCSGLTCSFDASSSAVAGGDIVRYEWAFGDGSTGSGVTASRSYEAGGSYTVSLTVIDSRGASSRTTRAVVVSAGNQAPVAHFSASCELLACTFTDGSTDADGFVVARWWSFGDGASSSTRHPSHTFSAPGTYTVVLAVTDDAGATGSTSQSVTVAASVPGADFTYTCSDTSCRFTDASVSANGVKHWTWSFGDGGTSSMQNPSYVYRASGTYTVRLDVTDEYGQQSSTTRSVTVAAPATGITLTASPYRVKGVHYVDLVWSGATGSQVTIVRDGVLVGAVPNVGRHSDAPDSKGRADYRYQLCAIDTGACSAEVQVEFR